MAYSATGKGLPDGATSYTSTGGRTVQVSEWTPTTTTTPTKVATRAPGGMTDSQAREWYSVYGTHDVYNSITGEMSLSYSKFMEDPTTRTAPGEEPAPAMTQAEIDNVREIQMTHQMPTLSGGWDTQIPTSGWEAPKIAVRAPGGMTDTEARSWYERYGTHDVYDSVSGDMSSRYSAYMETPSLRTAPGETPEEDMSAESVARVREIQTSSFMPSLWGGWTLPTIVASTEPSVIMPDIVGDEIPLIPPSATIIPIIPPTETTTPIIPVGDMTTPDVSGTGEELSEEYAEYADALPNEPAEVDDSPVLTQEAASNGIPTTVGIVIAVIIAWIMGFIG